MFREGMGAEMLSPREKIEQGSKDMDKAEQAALEKVNLPASKKNTIRLALGLATGLAIGMAGGEARALDTTFDFAQAMGSEDPGVAREAERAINELSQLRDSYESMTANDEVGAKKLAEFSGGMRVRKHKGSETKGDVGDSYMGDIDFSSWTHKRLAVAHAAGRQMGSERVDGEVDGFNRYKFDTKVFEMPEGAELVDTGNVVNANGMGDTAERAVANALAEAATVMGAQVRTGRFHFGKNRFSESESGFLSIGVTQTKSYVDGFEVVSVTPPAKEGEPFVVTIKAREAELKK